jgi:4-amino-4-deoxy-L-arabinose transferase-like glycosyltransferase
MRGNGTMREGRALRLSTALAVVLITALVVRLVFWVAVVGFDTTGWGDEPDYHTIASSIAAGEGFRGLEGVPTATRPPLYPIALGGLYSLTGPNTDAGRALQVALGVLIVLFVYLLAARLFSKKVALIAAGLAAVNPGLVYLSALLMTENLYILLLLGLFLVVLEDLTSGRVSYVRFAAGGVLAGLTALARPTAFVFALAVPALALAGERENVRRRVRASALFIVLALLVIAPWPIRNQAALGEWVTFTTHGGITFYESNNRLVNDVPAFRGSVVLPRTAVPRWDELADLDEVELDRQAWAMGWEFVRENPELLPRMAGWKFARFWRFDSGLRLQPTTDAVAGPQGIASLATSIDLGLVYWAIVIPFFLLGLVATFRLRRDLVLLYAVIVVHTLLAVAFHGSIRARAPVEPVITIFAAAAAVWAVEAHKKRRRGATPASVRTERTGKPEDVC